MKGEAPIRADLPGLSRPGSSALPGLLGWRRRLLALGGLLPLLGGVVLLATSVGSVPIPLGTTFQVLLSRLFPLTPAWPGPTETIILDIRLPRILLAGLVGAALAISGASYQGLLRNPLADPYLLGVSQGAMLGAIIAFLLPGPGSQLVPLFAFLGAIGSVALVYSFARVGRTVPITTLILAGVAVGAFLTSISAYLLLTHADDRLGGMLSWLLGQLSLSHWGQVRLVLPLVLGGSALLFLHARPLNVMQLDEEQAQLLGVPVERVKLLLMAVATLITAAAVSFSGLIGFVGIIVPHGVRLLWGPDHRFLLPLCLLCGAIFLILADTVARTVLAPGEIPVGVVTALIGAPFFLYLLRQSRRTVF